MGDFSTRALLVGIFCPDTYNLPTHVAKMTLAILQTKQSKLGQKMKKPLNR